MMARNAFEGVRVQMESRLINLRHFVITISFIKPSLPRESGSLHGRSTAGIEHYIVLLSCHVAGAHPEYFLGGLTLGYM
jgi:hypothetical protein